MSENAPRKESRGERARRKSKEADHCYADTIEEIKAHYRVLLESRDRKIATLEKRLDRLSAEPNIYLGRKDSSEFRVLVVEPSSVLRTALMAALQRRFEVFGVADGYAALESLVAKPDLILTGLNLAHLDGIELLRHARRIAKDLPAIVMYGADDRVLARRAAALGARVLLQKPFRLAEAVAQVEAVATACKRPTSGYVFGVCLDPQERRGLYRLLDTRYRALFTASGSRAIAMADERPDVLVVDVAVADRSWNEIVAAFRSKREEIKVVAVCDPSHTHRVRATQTVRLDGLFVRPYTFDELLVWMERALARGRTHWGATAPQPVNE